MTHLVSNDKLSIILIEERHKHLVYKIWLTILFLHLYSPVVPYLSLPCNLPLVWHVFGRHCCRPLSRYFKFLRGWDHWGDSIMDCAIDCGLTHGCCRVGSGVFSWFLPVLLRFSVLRWLPVIAIQNVSGWFRPLQNYKTRGGNIIDFFWKKI